MYSPEQERVQRFMENKGRGSKMGQRLCWDPKAKTIRAVAAGDPDGDLLELTPSDMKHAA